MATSQEKFTGTRLEEAAAHDSGKKNKNLLAAIYSVLPSAQHPQKIHFIQCTESSFMIASARTLCAIFLCLAMPLIVRAQANNGSAAPVPPSPTPASATPAAPPAHSPAATPTVDPCEPPSGSQESDTIERFELSVASGSLVPIEKDSNEVIRNNYIIKNSKDVVVHLSDINPYRLKCTTSVNSTPIAETGVSAFLGLIGGVTGNVGANTPNPAPQPATAKTPSVETAVVRRPGQTPPKDCADQYRPKHDQVESLRALRDRINGAFRRIQQHQDDTLFAFAQQIAALRSRSECKAIREQAEAVANMPKFALSEVSVPDKTVVTPAQDCDDSKTQKNTCTALPEAIDELATRAQTLVATLNDDLATDAAGANCKTQLKSTIDQDSAFLGALINSTTAVPSAVTTWTNQVNAFNTVRSNMAAAQTSIYKVLGDPSNFALDTSIHGDQEVVTYTATCTPVDAPTIAAPGASSSSATPPASPTPAPATGSSWSHDFKFGIGPRFVLAGGLVISPLQQVKLSTTTNPGGSGDTANTIIQQEKSSTRLLPIAMLHARYWDFLPGDKWKAFYWVPNYLSVGVTAKSSDSQGTNIEYLFGPSWAFAGRQLFITAGAYAGQQQRLADFTNLTVGGTTGLSSSNLPLTQTTIWKAGFAITWAPGGK